MSGIETANGFEAGGGQTATLVKKSALPGDIVAVRGGKDTIHHARKIAGPQGAHADRGGGGRIWEKAK